MEVTHINSFCKFLPCAGIALKTCLTMPFFVLKLVCLLRPKKCAQLSVRTILTQKAGRSAQRRSPEGIWQILVFLLTDDPPSLEVSRLAEVRTFSANLMAHDF